MIGPNYWTTGITMRHDTECNGWAASLEFFDDGFCTDNIDKGVISTEGTLRTRYILRDGATPEANAIAAARAVMADAEKLGIEFKNSGKGSPSLYLHRDNYLDPYNEEGSFEAEAGLYAVGEALGWTDSRL